MLLESKDHIEENGEIGYTEAVYESDNVLSSLYFPNTNTLYVSFNRGHTYEYLNIDKDLFNLFNTADSQGKFLRKHIMGKEKFPYRKMFKLTDMEINELKEKRQINTEKENDDTEG
ncbi:MAG: KTSC domain-containing protein [bacterium]